MHTHTHTHTHTPGNVFRVSNDGNLIDVVVIVNNANERTGTQPQTKHNNGWKWVRNDVFYC